MSIENFRIELNNSTLSVTNQNGKIEFSKNFQDLNANSFNVDLDNDGIDEFLLNNKWIKDSLNYYTVYIFSAADSFYLVDSIYSGMMEPYTMYSGEINEIILITGSPDFDTLYSQEIDTIFSPLNCWQYNGSELAIINNQLYNLLISENESVMNFVDEYFNGNGKDCSSSQKLKQAIVTVYTNFYSAEEISNAEAFLKQYYKCSDLEVFKDFIKKLL